MAIQTNTLGTFDGGASKVEYTYDDVSHKVQSVVVTNTGAKNDLTLTIYGPDNVTPVRSWSATVGAGVKTFAVPQSGVNSVTLVSIVKGSQTYWVLPFATSIDG